MKTKKKVLVLNGQYLPGYKGGGPIQSCVNMIESLSDRFDFYVLCADRDYKEDKPYPDVKIGRWNRVGAAWVYYMAPGQQSLKGFEKLLKETEYDTVYLNGFFSPIYTIRPLLLRRLGRWKHADIVLAPRGDFTGGCENKKVKKYGYIFIARLCGLYKNLLWHASCEIEKKDILKKFPGVQVQIAPDLPMKYIPKEKSREKIPGELRLVFVSRIFPKKNIKYALEILADIKEGQVLFDIYGPMEDKSYWAECESVIRRLPPNIKARYRKEAPHDRIPQIFGQYHAFFFPTLGENYGHVIAEAMMNNCLCILSGGVTPWDDCAEAGNFVCSLSKPEEFVHAVRQLVGMDEKSFRARLAQARSYIAQKTDASAHIKLYEKMLDR